MDLAAYSKFLIQVLSYCINTLRTYFTPTKIANRIAILVHQRLRLLGISKVQSAGKHFL